MNESLDRMVGIVMVGLAGMLDGDDVRPGTLLARVVGIDDEAEGGDLLAEYVRSLFPDIDDFTLEAVLHRVADASEFAADLLDDLDGL